MNHKITRFIAVAALLGTLGLSATAQAQYRSQDEGQYGDQYGGEYGRGRNFVALTSNNKLVRSNDSGRVTSVNVTGTNGNLLGIDYRPANGMLYGLTPTEVYRIDPKSGVATKVSTLSITVNVGPESGVDFNPVVDRLRVVGSNDQNFRIDVDLGTVTMDSNINYAAGDRNSGRNPSLTAAAYTNSFAGGPDPSRTTTLYDIDYDRDVLTIQNPPNDGTLQTVGSIGVNFGRFAGFNISGRNDGLAVSNSSLYQIDLRSGRARRVANLPQANYIGLATPIQDRSGDYRDGSYRR